MALASVGGSATALISAGAANAATLNTWSGAGPLTTARENAAAAVLQNGQVLVVGGDDGAGHALSSAEVYDPTAGSNGTWTTDSHALATARSQASAVTMQNGEVLIVGGWTTGGTAVGTPEIYNPADGSFAATPTTNAPAVYDAGAVLLPSGNVLVVGGDTVSTTTPTPTNLVELYNPTANTWTAMNPMGSARAGASVVLLANGNVLAAGGNGSATLTAPFTTLATAEVYNPGGNTWTGAGTPTAQREAFAGVLPSGKVLVAGGLDLAGNATNVAQLYDPSAPAASAWTTTGLMTTPRNGASGAVLPNGTVMMAGGVNLAGTAQSSAEIYNPSTTSWTATSTQLAVARSAAASAIVPNGTFVVAGGLSGGAAVTNVDNYFAGVVPSFTSAATATATTGTAFSFTVQSAGTPTPTVTESGNLPAGITFAATTGGAATLTGKATSAAGSYTVTFTATNAAGITQQSFTLSVVQPAAPGYFVAEKNGTLFAYGQALASSSTVSVNAKTRPIVAIGRSPGTTGYYLVSALGNVYNEDGAPFFGSKAAAKLPSPIAAFAATPDGKGYWLAAANGTVYTFGDAVSYSALSVNDKVRSVVAMATTSDGKGYWLVTKLGNVYNYGDATFHGSKAATRLPAPIIGFGLSGDAKGYDLVSSGGNVWNLGDAGFYGSHAATKLPSKVAAFGTSLDGKGYYLVTLGGNVYNYGDAAWYGSPVAHKLVQPISSFGIPD